MSTETGTVYTVATIAEHTGLSEKYLKNSDSSLKRFIQTFPQLSPDGTGLNDDGLMIFDDYVRLCSALDANGKRRSPPMSFDEFKDFVRDEYDISPEAHSLVKAESELEIITPQIVSPLSMVDQFESCLDEVGDALAARVSQCFRAKITSKVEGAVATELGQLDNLLKQIKG